MKITNKIESYNKIIELGLNRFSEEIFRSYEIRELEDFINRYSASFYAIRDKSKAGGNFKLKVEAKDILNEVTGYDLFSVNVSSFNYLENQLLVGEILITDTNVSAVLSTNCRYSVRDAINDPDFNFVTTIFDDKTLDQIPCFNDVYNYIVKQKLKDIIVEFAYFDKLLGVNNENIIIYELRTEY